jgi:hypothetical protein
MTGPNRALRLAAAALVVAGGLLVASCGGGSVATTAIGTSTPNTLTVPVAGGTLSLPAASNGEAASIAVAAGATSGTTITASSSTSAPGSAPAPSSIERSTESISGAVPFFFVTFTVNQSLSATLFSSETVSLLNSFPSTAAYYVEFDDITSSPGTKLGCAGPGTVASLAATIANNGASGACSNTGSTPTLSSGHTYLLQFYYVAAGSASPSPQPSATASASVSGTQWMGSSVALPSLNSGAYTGALAQGSYSGSASDAWVVTYGNYNFGGVTGPTPPPNSGNVYAEVKIAATAVTGAASFTSGTAVPMTLTVPTTAGLSSVTVREWEIQNAPLAMCLNFTTGAAAYAITPSGAGLLSFATPLENSTVPIAEQTATGCTSIGADFNINPTGTGGGAWIMVTDN